MLFLLAGPLDIVRLGLGTRGALRLDAGLCLLFFVQHSIMVHKPFRRWQAKLCPEECGDAVYATASSLALQAIVVFWQRSDWLLIEFRGVYQIPFRRPRLAGASKGSNVKSDCR